jgi:hypothetical protein
MNRGAMSWFHIILTYDEKVIEYWTMFSLKQVKTKIIEEFEHVFGIVGKPLMGRI